MTTISIDLPNWLLLILAFAICANAIAGAALAWVKYKLIKLRERDL